MRWVYAAILGLCACSSQMDPPDAVPDQSSRAAPVIYVAAPKLGVAATLRKVGQNGAVTTWRSADGVQLSYRDGLLVATRGLGHDMMTADVSPLRTAIARGGGSYERRISRLTGAFALDFVNWRCQLRKTDARDYRETCKSPAGRFENSYRVDGAGRVIGSRQWVSEPVGALVTGARAR
ncbi:YjbF family lipoprotein [Yoonia sp. SS1-5]|uniref:YjbF family lipoprotein n=1 Tax=Yoonia rhodophyticola TaxID=3137370 RepID=A0AAN0M8Q3_9RHOB